MEDNRTDGLSSSGQEIIEGQKSEYENENPVPADVDHGLTDAIQGMQELPDEEKGSGENADVSEDKTDGLAAEAESSGVQEEAKQEKGRKHLRRVWPIMSVVFAAAAIVLAVLFAQANQEVASIQSKQQDAQKSLESTQSALEAAQSENEDLNGQVSSLKSEVEELTSSNKKLTSENDKLQSANDDLTEKNDELENGASAQLVEIKNSYESGNWQDVIDQYNTLHQQYNGSSEDTEAKKLADDAQAKLDEEAQKKAEEEAKGYETGITYDQLARTPDDYEGQKVKFSGEVVQVIESSSGDETQIRLAVNDDYDTILFGFYSSDLVSSRVLEDDEITIYGTSYGNISYQSTMGGTITIPAVSIEKIDQ